ncbi:porin, partial [Escherichia coli]|uniref:porin n=1 Tax=Escherichia coli TaxID=562 RepID=UPI00203347C4
MMSLWDALRMNMMISYQELVRTFPKALDVAGYKDSDRLNYIEIGTWYYFNKNMNVYTAYQINLLDKSDYVLAHGLNTDDQLAFGIVYQF